MSHISVRTGLAAILLAASVLMAPAASAQSGSARASVQPEASPVVATREEARRLQQAGDWDRASVVWRAIAEREPRNGEAVFNLGYCLHMGSHLEEALAVHTRASEFLEFRGIALYNVACARALLGDPDGAITALAESRNAGFDLGVAATDSDLDSLRQDPRFQAVVAEPAPPRGFLDRIDRLAGRAQMMYAEYSPRVRRSLEEAGRIAGHRAESLLGRIMSDPRLAPITTRAMSLFSRSNVQGADVGRQQDAAGPEGAISIRRAQQLQQSGQWEPAARVYAAVLAGDPENGTALFGRAYCLHMAGDHEAAIEAHQRAALVPELRGISLYNLGCAYALTGEPARAFEALRASHEAGFDLEKYLDTDADLTSLRDMPEFELLKIRVGGGL